MVNSGYSKDSTLAQLLRVLFFAEAQWEVQIKAVHIPGQQNVLADALSRNKMQLFFFAGSGSEQRINRGASATGGTASESPARLDVASLVPTVHQLFAAGLAPSTRRAYRSGAVRYTRFCTMANRPPFPVREETVMLFVSLLHKECLALGTVKSYLAAVRFEQISRGMGDPEIGKMPRLEYVIKGMKRKAPKTARCRLPIILIRMRQVWDRSPTVHDAKMLWAASSLCFFGFLRSGEVVMTSPKEYDPEYDPAYHLGFKEVRLDCCSAPTFLQVQIKASKTDPFRQGVTVYVGRTDNGLCPAAVLSYLVGQARALYLSGRIRGS